MQVLDLLHVYPYLIGLRIVWILFQQHLPISQSAIEILRALPFHNAPVEQCIGVTGIILQDTVELGEGVIGVMVKE